MKLKVTLKQAKVKSVKTFPKKRTVFERSGPDALARLSDDVVVKWLNVDFVEGKLFKVLECVSGSGVVLNRIDHVIIKGISLRCFLLKFRFILNKVTINCKQKE